MNKGKSKNDEAWEKLFNKYHIEQCVKSKGLCAISANEIKEYREPRLMTKFDSEETLPQIFIDNNLAILPVTRGDYVISHFDAYHKLEENDPVTVERVSLPSWIQSLNIKDITSEAIALNCAAAAGIIKDFIDDGDTVATISGKMGSGDFSFKISDTPNIENGKSHRIEVRRSQIEIDAGYESAGSMAVFEAKLNLLPDNFLIRQLYYPFRVWRNKVQKRIRPVFFLYSNGEFQLYEYAFENEEDYNSLELVKRKNYAIVDTEILQKDISNILQSVAILDEPDVPFPQADRFDRVVNLCELANEDSLDKSAITEKYGFDQRQTDYYANAALYLGLLEKKKYEETVVYSTSKLGKNILSLKYRERQLKFCECILSHKVFNEIGKLYFQNGTMPPDEVIVNVMKKSNLRRIESDSTFERRASSIKGWINWINSLYK